MICSECGKQMEPGARFCSACGTVLVSPEALPPISDLPPKTSQEALFVKSLTRAHQTAQRLKDLDKRDWALREIAVAFARLGQFSSARRAACEIESPEFRTWTLHEIVLALAKAGQFEQALQLAQEIEDALERAKTLANTAGILAETNQVPQAHHALSIALQVVKTVDASESRDWAMVEIAIAQAKMGQSLQAFRTAHEIEDDTARAYAFAGIAEPLLALGHESLAKQAIDHALISTTKIGEGIGDTYALQEIALTQARVGWIEQALQLAEQLTKEPVQYIETLLSIGEVLMGGTEGKFD